MAKLTSNMPKIQNLDATRPDSLYLLLLLMPLPPLTK